MMPWAYKLRHCARPLHLYTACMVPAGYFGASGVNEYAVWATMLYHRYQHRAEDFGERAMPYGR